MHRSYLHFHSVSPTSVLSIFRTRRRNGNERRSESKRERERKNHYPERKKRKKSEQKRVKQLVSLCQKWKNLEMSSVGRNLSWNVFIFDWYSSCSCFFPWLTFDQLIEFFTRLPPSPFPSLKTCSSFLLSINKRRTKTIMGCVSSKKKLSKADLEFLEENTEFTKDQIMEWYEGFIVSHFASQSKRLSSSTSFIHQTIIWFISMMKLLFLFETNGVSSWVEDDA